MKVGDKVKIRFTPFDVRVVPDMRRYNGHAACISKVHTYRVTRPNGAVATMTMYELENVVSSEGVPYTFNADIFSAVIEGSDYDT